MRGGQPRCTSVMRCSGTCIMRILRCGNHSCTGRYRWYAVSIELLFYANCLLLLLHLVRILFLFIRARVITSSIELPRAKSELSATAVRTEGDAADLRHPHTLMHLYDAPALRAWVIRFSCVQRMPPLYSTVIVTTAVGELESRFRWCLAWQPAVGGAAIFLRMPKKVVTKKVVTKTGRIWSPPPA